MGKKEVNTSYKCKGLCPCVWYQLITYRSISLTLQNLPTRQIN
jgi:hypothetical protein